MHSDNLHLMRRMLRISILAVFTFIALASAEVPAMQINPPKQIPSLEVTEQQVLAAEQERLRAFVQEDVITLKSLLGGDYYHVDSYGRVRSKTEFLQALERGEFADIKITVGDTDVTRTGAIAVVRGVLKIERRSTPVVEKYSLRYVRLWQFISGHWVNTFHQTTRVRPSAQEHYIGML